MKITKYIVNICLIVLTLVSLIMSGVYLYYHLAVKPNHTSIGTNYIGKQVSTDLVLYEDELTEAQIQKLEDRVLFNINSYSNKNNNGIELNEFRLDYFTDYTMTTATCRSVGMQVLFDLTAVLDYELAFFNNDFAKANEKIDYLNSINDINAYYYTTYDDISWAGYVYDENGSNTTLNRDLQFVVNIDNTPYLMQLNGQRAFVEDKYFLWWKTGEETTYQNLDWSNLFLDLLYSVKTNSKGFGDYYILFDCSEYFTNIKAYNEETGKFDKLPNVDIVNNYSYIKFHYDENGATQSTQSFFDTIALDTKYGMSDSNIDYWSERVTYNINESTKINNQSVIKYRYSEVYGGYFASLNLDIKNLFINMPRTKINITLDLNKLLVSDINVIGIDYNAFEDFKIDTLTIKGSGNFYILDKAFYNTNIQRLMYSNQLFLDISDTAFNNNYVEVVL